MAIMGSTLDRLPAQDGAASRHWGLDCADSSLVQIPKRRRLFFTVFRLLCDGVRKKGTARHCDEQAFSPPSRQMTATSSFRAPLEVRIIVQFGEKQAFRWDKSTSTHWARIALLTMWGYAKRGISLTARCSIIATALGAAVEYVRATGCAWPLAQSFELADTVEQQLWQSLAISLRMRSIGGYRLRPSQRRQPADKARLVPILPQ